MTDQVEVRDTSEIASEEVKSPDESKLGIRPSSIDESQVQTYRQAIEHCKKDFEKLGVGVGWIWGGGGGGVWVGVVGGEMVG